MAATSMSSIRLQLPHGGWGSGARGTGEDLSVSSSGQAGGGRLKLSNGSFWKDGGSSSFWTKAFDTGKSRRRSQRRPQMANATVGSSSFDPKRKASGHTVDAIRAGEADVDAAGERQELFDRIAPMYDRLNDWLSLGQHRTWKRMTIKWSKASKGHKALDICCGSGDIAFLLADAVGYQGTVVGLDFAAEQLAVARERSKGSPLHAKTIQWVQGDALALPFDDDEFDAVTMGYGLRNVTDIRQSLSEIHRVLKKGSSAAILDFNHSTDVVTDSVQRFMLERVVVSVASRFGVEREYRYLRPSIERYPTGDRLVKLGRDAGFLSAAYYEIGFGFMGVLVLKKR